MNPEDLKRFYDATLFQRRDDLEMRNPRVAILRWLLEHEIPPRARVLDLGCGIGWSTHTIRRLGARALGVDFAPALIEEARRRYGGDFLCADASALDLTERFSVGTCLDCLEHLPPEQRSVFYRTMDVHLEPGGSFLLNLPNPSYLTHLRAQDPSRLQPVDEPVPLEEILRELGGGFVLATAILYGIDLEDQYLWYRFQKAPCRWTQPIQDPWARIPPWPAVRKRAWIPFWRNS